ncbi:DUF1656 domain-containing protein [Allorhizobium undicola]|uniref:DUF1656 domain-containing protein n=1 Tax=Allorhizobium undicola TaxID=78527 RepID=UPI000483E9DF|nr:DUF1656 domain-containing protein [Allorhizobium undicola]
MQIDFDFFGLLVPRLLLLMLLALVLNMILRRILGWIGFYRMVWHRGLFDIALYVILLGGIAALTRSL